MTYELTSFAKQLLPAALLLLGTVETVHAQARPLITDPVGQVSPVQLKSPTIQSTAPDGIAENAALWGAKALSSADLEEVRGMGLDLLLVPGTISGPIPTPYPNTSTKFSPIMKSLHDTIKAIISN